jgi:hypothetical protein
MLLEMARSATADEDLQVAGNGPAVEIDRR